MRPIRPMRKTFFGASEWEAIGYIEPFKEISHSCLSKKAQKQSWHVLPSLRDVEPGKIKRNFQRGLLKLISYLGFK